ncbi:hypothetical protein GCM10010272_46450 [Streptomyces lateritius]|nr:hypothetical protein GCM10010272_46450 [Streptomyces lateritius]
MSPAHRFEWFPRDPHESAPRAEGARALSQTRMMSAPSATRHTRHGAFATWRAIGAPRRPTCSRFAPDAKNGAVPTP